MRIGGFQFTQEVQYELVCLYNSDISPNLLLLLPIPHEPDIRLQLQLTLLPLSIIAPTLSIQPVSL